MKYCNKLTIIHHTSSFSSDAFEFDANELGSRISTTCIVGSISISKPSRFIPASIFNAYIYCCGTVFAFTTNFCARFARPIYRCGSECTVVVYFIEFIVSNLYLLIRFKVNIYSLLSLFTPITT